jgi:formylglycine-generating enzyme required for sulfatase activity
LRAALADRCRDPLADLRERLAAGFALGTLGDPRFERIQGPEGSYLRPPLVDIPGGSYPIGDDDPIDYPDGVTKAHVPRHTVSVAAFRLGRYPVTNAEFACFLAAGGYEDERWWDTAAGRNWRLGIGTAAGIHANVRDWVARCRANPESMDKLKETGQWDEEQYERGLRRVRMTEAELDAHLRELYPEQRFTEPQFWRDERFNNPSQPVVGLTWYEARAYCAWLSAQMAAPMRLPTEVEWEAAARETAARRFAYGDSFDPLAGNTLETRLRRPSPVGAFVTGDTPEGLSDMAGNVFEWTSSAFGKDFDVPEFGYPYSADDGREDPEAATDVQRVTRGGAWFNGFTRSRAACRIDDLPDFRNFSCGFRVAASLG